MSEPPSHTRCQRTRAGISRISGPGVVKRGRRARRLSSRRGIVPDEALALVTRRFVAGAGPADQESTTPVTSPRPPSCTDRYLRNTVGVGPPIPPYPYASPAPTANQPQGRDPKPRTRVPHA